MSSKSQGMLFAEKVLAKKKLQLIKSMTNYSKNLQWIAENRSSLRKRYPDEYVAVRNMKICIHDKNYNSFLQKIQKKYGYSPEIVVDFIGKKKISLLL